jgi:glutamate-1-semialdehyde aminotransferase
VTFDLRKILDEQRPDGHRLFAEHVNPRFAQVLRTIGFDRFFDRAEGQYLWDERGNRYLDFMCAYGPNLFGYGHETIDAAYIGQLQHGDTLTGPSALIVELAEALTVMVTHADWAIFCKNGTDATTMALVTDTPRHPLMG